MTGPAAADLERLVEWTLRRYRRHPEWEDIRQEGLLRALEDLAAVPDRAKWSTIAHHAAIWGAAAYLRSRRCHPDHYRRRDGRAAEVRLVPLSEWRGAAGDFSGRIIARVHRQQVAALARRVCTPSQWEAFEHVVLRGQSAAVAARQLGKCSATVKPNLRRALAAVRRALWEETHAAG